MHPKHILDLTDEKTLAFHGGSFVNSKGINVVVSFSIYNNGLVAEASSSTDDAEQFLQQASREVASKDFGLTLPRNVGRAYISQLEVESEFSLSAFNPKLADLAHLLTQSVSTVDKKPRKFDFGAVQLWTEDTNLTTSPAYFRFERKVGAAFSRNRYFSQAALDTHEHFEFLKSFENEFNV